MKKQSDIGDNELYRKLLALCKKVIDKTNEYKKQGKLVAIPYQYLPVKDIDYRLETFHYNWDGVEYFDFYQWRSMDFKDFMDQVIFTLPECEQAAKEIAEEFNIVENDVKQIGLFSLLRLIVKEAPNGRISNDNIDHYVQLLIDDYESERSNKPTTWKVDLWLGNIIIESDEVEIAPNVFLRRPKKEQLADKRPTPPYVSEFEQWTGRELIYGAILSYSIQATKSSAPELYPKEIDEKTENWLNAFRLFRPSDVIVIYKSISPESVFKQPIYENVNQPYDRFRQGNVDHRDTSSHKLYLKKDDEVLLGDFVQTSQSIFHGFLHDTYLTGDSLNLALHRYNDSLLNSEVNVYRILSSITSLEALLSEAGSEITFKIRLRVAKLLSFFGFNALEVSNKMKDAYSLRSKLVHGSKLKRGKNSPLEFARHHTHEILNFNRICLLVSLQLNNLIGKQELIEKIDDSFIDPTANEELKKLILEKVKVPVVNPFVRIDRHIVGEN